MYLKVNNFLLRCEITKNNCIKRKRTQEMSAFLNILELLGGLSYQFDMWGLQLP